MERVEIERVSVEEVDRSAAFASRGTYTADVALINVNWGRR